MFPARITVAGAQLKWQRTERGKRDTKSSPRGQADHCRLASRVARNPLSFPGFAARLNIERASSTFDFLPLLLARFRFLRLSAYSRAEPLTEYTSSVPRQKRRAHAEPRVAIARAPNVVFGIRSAASSSLSRAVPGDLPAPLKETRAAAYVATRYLNKRIECLV